MENNLPDLRDIHLPAEGVSFWPLAYGWWVILFSAVLLLLCCILIRFLLRKSKKRYALRIISSLPMSGRADIVKMSEILRRICVYKYPQATTMFGKDWINFLNSRCTRKISDSMANVLVNAPYMDTIRSVTAQDMSKLRDFCSFWIGENL